jgi:hypothetical protein
MRMVPADPARRGYHWLRGWSNPVRGHRGEPLMLS